MNNPQADILIDSGRPWSEVAQLFPNKIATYEYFASSMTRRFASADLHCVMCGRHCDTLPIAFKWRANLHTSKTVLVSFLITAITIFAHHLYSRWTVVEFTTVHRLCSDCRRRHHTRSIALAILHKFLFATLILLIFLTVPLIIFLFVAIFAAPEGRRLMLTGSIVGIALLGLVMWSFELCRRFLIPESLRKIGRFPFFLYEIRDTA